MSPRLKLFISIVLLSVTTVVSAAEPKLELAAPFTNNMILQRQAMVPVWGFDAPNTQVTGVGLENGYSVRYAIRS